MLHQSNICRVYDTTCSDHIQHNEAGDDFQDDINRAQRSTGDGNPGSWPPPGPTSRRTRSTDRAWGRTSPPGSPSTDAVNSRRRKDLMKPQQFDGTDSVNSFIAHFEVCAEFNDWSDRDKFYWLQWALRGRAQQVMWDLPKSQLMSYTHAVVALRERYGSEHQCELYRIELQKRRRGPLKASAS